MKTFDDCLLTFLDEPAANVVAAAAWCCWRAACCSLLSRPGAVLRPADRQEPAPQPAAHDADQPGDHRCWCSWSRWSGRSSAFLDLVTTREEPRTSRPSSPSAGRSPARCRSPTPRAWPTAAAPQAGRRPARRLHDLAVLRRHARPGQADAREHRLLLRMDRKLPRARRRQPTPRRRSTADDGRPGRADRRTRSTCSTRRAGDGEEPPQGASSAASGSRR